MWGASSGSTDFDLEFLSGKALCHLVLHESVGMTLWHPNFWSNRRVIPYKNLELHQMNGNTIWYPVTPYDTSLLVFFSTVWHPMTLQFWVLFHRMTPYDTLRHTPSSALCKNLNCIVKNWWRVIPCHTVSPPSWHVGEACHTVSFETQPFGLNWGVTDWSFWWSWKLFGTKAALIMDTLPSAYISSNIPF